MKIFFTISGSGKSTLIKNSNSNYIFFENVIERIYKSSKELLLVFISACKKYNKEVIFLENCIIYDMDILKKLSELADIYFITFTKEQYEEIFERKEKRNIERFSRKENDYNIRNNYTPKFCNIIKYNKDLSNTIKLLVNI